MGQRIARGSNRGVGRRRVDDARRDHDCRLQAHRPGRGHDDRSRAGDGARQSRATPLIAEVGLFEAK